MNTPLEHVATALRVLATRDPDALDVIVLHQPDPGPWAMCGGIAWRHTKTRYWTSTVEHGETSVPWNTLWDAVDNDPRLPPIRRWVENLPNPSWRYRHRPYMLRHHPGGFHPRFAQADFQDPEWTRRRRHWETLLRILHDAENRLTRQPPDVEQLDLLTHLSTMEGATA